MHNSTLVISHGRCTDGFCSAWVMRKIYPDAQFHFANFGETPPDTTDKKVFVLDFSYKRNVLLNMRANSDTLNVIDHHKTAAADLKGLSFCLFDMNYSGAGLTWRYLSKKDQLPETIPWIVKYVEDRDLLRNSLPDTEIVNAYIASKPLNFADWDQFTNLTLEQVKEEGRPIWRFQQQLCSDLKNYAREVSLDGYKVLAINTSVMNTDIAMMLAKDRPFGIVWFQRDDGKYIYSLRSNGSIDVGEVAKRFGGGGHPFSAGFSADKLLI